MNRYVPVDFVSEKSPLSTVRAIAISQIVIGSLCFVLAITAFFLRGFEPANFEASGFVGGIWIIVTGIIGVFSSRKRAGTCLGATYLGFSLVSCAVALCDSILFTVCVISFPNDFRYYGVSITQVLDGIVLFLMVGELCLAFTASILCCLYQVCTSLQGFGYNSRNQFRYAQMNSKEFNNHQYGQMNARELNNHQYGQRNSGKLNNYQYTQQNSTQPNNQQISYDQYCGHPQRDNLYQHGLSPQRVNFSDAHHFDQQRMGHANGCQSIN